MKSKCLWLNILVLINQCELLRSIQLGNEIKLIRLLEKFQNLLNKCIIKVNQREKLYRNLLHLYI